MFSLTCSSSSSSSFSLLDQLRSSRTSLCNVGVKQRCFFLQNFFTFQRATSYENPPRATQYQSTKRFDNLQADVNQVVDVMKDNLEKVLERDAKLSTLENRAGKNSPKILVAHAAANRFSYREFAKWCIAIYDQCESIKTKILVEKCQSE